MYAPRPEPIVSMVLLIPHVFRMRRQAEILRAVVFRVAVDVVNVHLARVFPCQEKPSYTVKSVLTIAVLDCEVVLKAATGPASSIANLDPSIVDEPRENP